MKYYIYIFKDPITDIPFYVGKGSKNRFRDHLKETISNTTNKIKFCKLQSINFNPKIIIIPISNDENTAYDVEESLIKFWGRKIDGGILTNITENSRPPEGIKFGDPDHPFQLNPRTGSRHPFFGKKHTKESKIIMSEKAKNRLHTDDTRKKMSENRKGSNNSNFKEVDLIQILKLLIKDPYINLSSMAKVFNVSRPTLTKRIKDIFPVDNLQTLRYRYSENEIRDMFQEKLNAISHSSRRIES